MAERPIGQAIRAKYPTHIPVALDLSAVKKAKHFSTSRTPSMIHRLIVPGDRTLLSSLFHYLSKNQILPPSSPAIIGLSYMIVHGSARIFVTGTCTAQAAWDTYAQRDDYLLHIIVCPENIFG